MMVPLISSVTDNQSCDSIFINIVLQLLVFLVSLSNEMTKMLIKIHLNLK